MSGPALVKPPDRLAARRLDAVIGGPLWWVCHLGGFYWLVPRACRWDATWPLHLLTIVLLVLAARALLSGLQVLASAREAQGADTPNGDAQSGHARDAHARGGEVQRGHVRDGDAPGGRVRRDVFVGTIGIALSAFFGTVIVAEWLPVLQLGPCW